MNKQLSPVTAPSLESADFFEIIVESLYFSAFESEQSSIENDLAALDIGKD